MTRRDRTGQIILSIPTMAMLEVLVSSDLLDIILAEKLNMEGGRTGQHVMIKPSRLVSSADL